MGLLENEFPYKKKIIGCLLLWESIFTLKLLTYAIYETRKCVEGMIWPSIPPSLGNPFMSSQIKVVTHFSA